MNFVNIVPPKYDCEVLKDQAMREREVLIEDTGEENMIALGFSKGTFAFVSVHDTDKVYARFSIHRQPITRIQKINFGGAGKSRFDKPLEIHSVKEEGKESDGYSQSNQTSEFTPEVLFMSMCAEFSMHIWGFKDGNIIVYKSFKTLRQVNQVSFCSDTMLMSFQSRD